MSKHGHAMGETAAIIETVRSRTRGFTYPVTSKFSATQDYVAIARGVVTFAEAIAINSVAWEKVFPKKKSPLAKLEARLKRDTGAGGGGGGVSGRAAQFSITGE